MKLKWECTARALKEWEPGIKAVRENGKETLDIYDTIGEDPWTGMGITAKLVSSVLRKADGKDIVVNINSPGGDFFEGLAIYTLLKEYEGIVTVNVIGLAASAASIVAMAGDEINIAEPAFIMIHNSWTLAVGNRNDMQEVSSLLSKFDKSMCDLYAKKTGYEKEYVASMMDDETWMSSEECIERNFADNLIENTSIAINEDKQPKNKVLRKVDCALAQAGMSRSERRELIGTLTKDTPSAVEPKPSASLLNNSLNELLHNLNS